MATPEPTPQPSPSDLSSLIGGLSAQVNQSPSGGGSLYGLGSWGAQPVDPGSLPWAAAIMSNAVGADGKPAATITGDAIVEAFAHLTDTNAVAQIQQALYLAGYYPSTYTPSFGVLKPDDVTAFAASVKLAGQAAQPVSDLLASQAEYGAAAGVAAAKAATGSQLSAPQLVNTVTLTASQDLEAQARQAFQQALGRNPTPAEAATFAGAYQAVQAGVQRANDRAAYNAELDRYQSTLPTTAPPGLPAAPGTPAGVQGAQLGLGNVPHGVGYSSYDTTGENGQYAGDFNDRMMTLGQSLSQAQAEAQTAGQAQQAPSLTEVPQQSAPDPSVAAANFARNTNPTEAGASDLADTFNTFLQLIAGKMG